jgi:predicted nucleic acid-binding protein
VITHLAETSLLTRITTQRVHAALVPFLNTACVGRCTLSDLEMGFSASNAREWQARQSVLAALDPVDVTPAVIARAKVVQHMLAQHALKGRKVPDLIIAAAAELADLIILHYDQDFEIIASVTGQRHEWIVPRGTVD